MANGSDSHIAHQSDAPSNPTGDAAMSHTAAQTYAGGDYQNFSQGAFAQSAKDSHDMTKGPNPTLGDLQLSGHDGGRSGIAPDASKDASRDTSKDDGKDGDRDQNNISAPPGANEGAGLSAGQGSQAGKDAGSGSSEHAGDHRAAGQTHAEIYDHAAVGQGLDGGRDVAQAGKDGSRDLAQAGKDGGAAAGPPEIKLPTPEAVGSAPVEHLQSYSQDARQSLNDYVQSQGGNIPDIALHGTTESSGRALSEQNQKGEIFVAGQHPDRKDMGADQYVRDLSVAAQTSIGYSEKHAGKGGAEAGPVLVYDASNQPKAWDKNNYPLAGSTTDGHSPGDQAKVGQLDLSQANLVGSIPREQLDGMKQQFAPLHQALGEKQNEIMKSPSGPDKTQVKDLLDRVQVVNELQRLNETRAVLNAVSRNRPQW